MTAAAGPPVPPMEPPPPPPAPTNGLGLAGFIVSLVGLIPCGVGCPIGLILSLVALRKEPRGFAIAGTVIGALGSLFALLVGLGLFLAFVGVKEAMKNGPEPIHTTLSLIEAEQAIEVEKAEKGRLPSAEKGNAVIAELRDGWERAMRYEPRDDAFTIRSAGADGVFGNADDQTTDGR